MRFAYVGGANIPSRKADSIHIMKVCSAFADANAQAFADSSVTLITPGDIETEQGVGDIYEYYGVKNNFFIERTYIKLPRFPTKHIRRAYKMARLAAEGNYDIYYTRDVRICFFMAIVFRRPVYFEYHTPFAPNTKEDKLFLKIIETVYFRKLIVITNALKQHFIARYDIKGDKIFTAPDGADMPEETQKPEELTPASKGKYHIGYIGHLYKGRGMELLGDMAASCPFAYFHIIGGNEDDILYWKSKYSDIKNIHFYGFVPPSRAPGFGKAMDVLIAPYQREVKTAYSAEPSTAEWMSPLKIFEYMALGKPIVCSDMPVLREVLTDNVNGMLCPPEDAGAWSRAISKLYHDKEHARRLSCNALKQAEKYTWNARARNILECIAGDAAAAGEETNMRSGISKTYIFRLLKWGTLVLYYESILK